ncbi:MAG: hypothetical protein WC533_01815 [Candidatus Pacearchaeota archaeon]
MITETLDRAGSIVDNDNLLHVCAWCDSIIYEDVVVAKLTKNEHEILHNDSLSGYQIGHTMCKDCRNDFK